MNLVDISGARKAPDEAEYMMSSGDERQAIKRRIQILIGTVVLVAGLGLMGFAALLVYADLIRDLPSKLVVHMVIGGCGTAGILCLLVGLRLISGRRTPADRLLLSATAWHLVGLIFIGLAVVVAIRGRLTLAIPGLAFAALCFFAGRSIARGREPAP